MNGYLSGFQTRRKVYPNTHQRLVNMANERIPELTSEIGRDLEVSAPPPQMVHNTTAGGGIHQLNPMVSVYQKDLFINHLRSMPPLDPVADLLISSSTASLADVLTPTPTQQTEYLLQPSMLNVAQSSNMAKNESMMLQIDSNKQLPHKTKGILQPSFVASAADSMVIDPKRKGKEHHGECHTEEAKYKHTGRWKRGRVSPSVQKSRDKHNLSEKKRRDKINETYKNLQELTGSNKKDQLSILDAAIAQIKLLQWQKKVLSGQEQFCIMPHNQPAPKGSPI